MNDNVCVTFLGTGTSQGVPIIGCSCEVCKSVDVRDQRLRSSVVVETQGVRMIIDTSMDFRQQMLREGITAIDAVLYTHQHRDHTGGMDDLRAYNYLMGKEIDIFCTTSVAQELEMTFGYAFDKNPYPGVPRLILHEIDRDVFHVKSVAVTPIKGRHFVIDVTGFRIGNMAYLTDFDMIYEDQYKKLNELDVLIINALRRVKHKSHFCLDEALEVIERVKPKRAYLTHMSHQIGRFEKLERELPKGVFAAYDGLEIYTNE